MADNKKVLLIDPTWRNGQLHGPSLGLAYLASALKTEGAIVKICDFVRQGSEKAKTLFDFKRQEDSFLETTKNLSSLYEIIGITCNYATFYRALKVAESCRSGNQNAIIVLGGPHVSGLNYLSLAKKEELLPVDKNINLYVFGEGEDTFKEILRKSKSPKDLRKIIGTIYRDKSCLIRNNERDLIKDLNSINQPSWEVFDLDLYPRLLPITASRGCPYRCSFCDERLIWKNKYRYRSPESIVEELRNNVVLYGITNFRFADSQLTCYPSLEKMCTLIQKEGLNIKWSCYARANELNAFILDSMKRAGCTSLLLGIESGTQEVLNAMNKKTFLQNTANAVKLAKLQDIAVEASLIIGFPGETEKNVYKTIEFAKSLNADSYDWHSFFPGLEMLSQPDIWDLKVNNVSPWNVDLDIPPHLYPELFIKYPESVLIERHASARIPLADISNKDYGYIHKTLSLSKIYSLIRYAIKETQLAGLSTEESIEYKILLDQ